MRKVVLLTIVALTFLTTPNTAAEELEQWIVPVECVINKGQPDQSFLSKEACDKLLNPDPPDPDPDPDPDPPDPKPDPDGDPDAPNTGWYTQLGARSPSDVFGVLFAATVIAAVFVYRQMHLYDEKNLPRAGAMRNRRRHAPRSRKR